MSHELTVRQDGTVEMFSAGPEPVWHQLGQRTETAVTSAAAIRMAGLDWTVAELLRYRRTDFALDQK